MELATRAVSKFDLTLTTTPLDALVEALDARYQQWRLFDELIHALPLHPEDDEYVPPAGKSADGPGHPGYWIRGKPGWYGRTYHVSGTPTGEAKPHVLVELHERATKELSKLAAECAKIGIDVRELELREDAAAMVARAITHVIVGLGHDPSSDVARRIGAEALRKAGGSRALGEGHGG